MDDSKIKYIFIILVSCPNFLFFIYWVYHTRIEILKELFQKKYFKLITLLTLRPYNEDLFYEKYLKGDPSYHLTHDNGQKTITHVGVELHESLKL